MVSNNFTFFVLTYFFESISFPLFVGLYKSTANEASSSGRRKGKEGQSTFLNEEDAKKDCAGFGDSADKSQQSSEWNKLTTT